MELEQHYPQRCKSIAGPASGSENSHGFFDCNICFDFAREPVVTLCGHLYCWPCIYKWLHVQAASLASDYHPQCPVCKAGISHTTMVPLYGRGQGPSKRPHQDVSVPPRLSAYGPRALVSNTSDSSQQRLHRNPNASPATLLNLGGSAVAGMHYPFVGMFRELVYARGFGHAGSSRTYPNSYRLMMGNNNRLRRQERQADKSLNRISFFLFCCFLLCLLVF